MTAKLAAELRPHVIPLAGGLGDYDALLEQAAHSRVVCLGEASHGTHEFYHERAEITKRLITELGFTAVCAEADWPDAYRVNRYVRHTSDDANAVHALDGFRRFPQWMWRNTAVVDFVEWLRAFNDETREPGRHAGFYGIDLYSLHNSMDAVLRYLEEVDPEAATRARFRYGCFDHFGEDPQAYGYAASYDMSQSCEQAVLRQLLELRQRASEYAGGDPDEYFYAEQNARLVINAERYYRSMFKGRASSWNLRDTHMADTLDALLAHLSGNGANARVVVWAHNSHLGDARATEMGRGGEINVGQLVRERHPGETLLVGFSTYTGSVTAATDWDDPAERRRVRPGLRGSIESLAHDLGLPRFLLPLTGAARGLLAEPLLERAIGVIYRPESERQSHYFHARVAEQFDALIHIDETRAVEPLERTATWESGEMPETYPSAL